MSSFGGLYIGASGLNVSQSALNVTAHNLANVDTKGFSRQQAVIADFKYLTIGESYASSMQAGLGTKFAEVRQIRDIFLDRAYRQEIGRKAFYESQYQAVSEIQGLFGELEGVQFQNTLKDLWVTLQEVAKEPDNIVKRASLVQTSVSFIERAENIYNQLCDYQVNLNTQIKNQVNRINEIGEEIKVLNKKISLYESNGLENANDLRDQRNLLLDELGEIAEITYSEDKNGVVTVNLEGMPFVTEDMVYRMTTVPVSEGSQMLKPVWESFNNMDVFNLDRPPSSEDNTDIGSLKGLLVARGGKQANYTDLNISSGDYTRSIYPSVVMSVQAQFDQLVHGIVTMINDTLSPNKEVTLSSDTQVTIGSNKVTLAAGTKIQILDEENAPVSMDSSGTMGEVLFTRKSMNDRYTDVQDIEILDKDGNPITVKARILLEEDPNDRYSLFTIGEIQVNSKILLNNSLLPLSKNDGTGAIDLETAQKLVSNWQEPFAALSPDTLTTYNFDDYYTAFISEIANRGEKINNISESQASMVTSIDNQRSNVAGVSSDEELTNLIKYQHSYNAAARYINVVNEMLEHIINNL